MEDEVENRLLRFEDKMDKISEKINAFPVVGQRIADVERRLGHIEVDVHELRSKTESTAVSVGKLLAVVAIIVSIGTMIVREAIAK